MYGPKKSNLKIDNYSFLILKSSAPSEAGVSHLHITQEMFDSFTSRQDPTIRLDPDSESFRGLRIPLTLWSHPAEKTASKPPTNFYQPRVGLFKASRLTSALPRRLSRENTQTARGLRGAHGEERHDCDKRRRQTDFSFSLPRDISSQQGDARLFLCSLVRLF